MILFCVDIDFCVTVLIEDIREVRTGKSTEVLRAREFTTGHKEDCAFAIICGEEYESLDLIASTPEEASIWVSGLNALLGSNKCK